MSPFFAVVWTVYGLNSKFAQMFKSQNGGKRRLRQVDPELGAQNRQRRTAPSHHFRAAGARILGFCRRVCHISFSDMAGASGIVICGKIWYILEFTRKTRVAANAKRVAAGACSWWEGVEWIISFAHLLPMRSEWDDDGRPGINTLKATFNWSRNPWIPYSSGCMIEAEKYDRIPDVPIGHFCIQRSGLWECVLRFPKSGRPIFPSYRTKAAKLGKSSFIGFANQVVVGA